MSASFAVLSRTKAVLISRHHQLKGDVNLSQLQKTVKKREAWHAAVHGDHQELDMTEQLNSNISGQLNLLRQYFKLIQRLLFISAFLDLNLSLKMHLSFFCVLKKDTLLLLFLTFNSS